MGGDILGDLWVDKEIGPNVKDCDKAVVGWCLHSC
jgi:hypothetical protein